VASKASTLPLPIPAALEHQLDVRHQQGITSSGLNEAARRYQASSAIGACLGARHPLPPSCRQLPTVVPNKETPFGATRASKAIPHVASLPRHRHRGPRLPTRGRFSVAALRASSRTRSHSPAPWPTDRETRRRRCGSVKPGATRKPVAEPPQFAGAARPPRRWLLSAKRAGDAPASRAAGRRFSPRAFTISAQALPKHPRARATGAVDPAMGLTGLLTRRWVSPVYCSLFQGVAAARGHHIGSTAKQQHG